MNAVELPERLPPLREDLQLHPAASNRDGSPAWTIQDPLNNAFYRIGWLEFELLSRWGISEPHLVLAETAAQTPLQPAAEELAVLYAFLLQHQLLSIKDVRYSRQLYEQQRQGRLGRLRWMLHHYLFFRVPLVHPSRFLSRTLPRVEWVYSRGCAILILCISALGLLLTARQWDSFAASFVDSLSPGGLLGYLLALALSKALHELGHAFTATRYGLRVAHMGVAFLVLWPMLYTDTGESWRLSQRGQRLAIASAGILSELALAGVALLAWNIAPEGDLKQALFFLASTAWLVSLTLNISPFMRFDGYFILSDALDMPNLHERSFAVARSAIRNTLLGWQEAMPEPLSTGKRRAMIAFAIATWLYRLMLFIGIAIAVYLLFFKLLGIFLFLVEIFWFVLRPLNSELRVWYQRRAEITRSRRWLATLAGSSLLLLALVPWSTQLQVSGWIHPSRLHVFYSPLPAQLLELPAAGVVSADSLLFKLVQPELDYRAEQAASAGQTVDAQLRGLASRPEGEEFRAQLLEQQNLHVAQQQAEQAEAGRLSLRAPFAGVLTDIDPELAPGVWVNPQQALAILVDGRQWEAELFVRQADLKRLNIGSAVRFYPRRQGQPSLSGRISRIDSTRSGQIPPLLSSQHGGPLAVLPDASGLTPRESFYRVQVMLDQAPDSLHVMSGNAVVEANPESWLIEAMKPALIMLIRELSF